MHTNLKWVVPIVLIGCVVGLIAILVVLSFADVTPRESSLLGVVLTIFSVVLGIVVTHIYSINSTKQAIADVREDHAKSLKTYARKAAEKVNNLSNELGRLAVYLEKELETDNYSNSEQELLAKEERIESAIHIINSLKSVNNTALSDWKGVIGEEIAQEQERAEEQTEELQNLVGRLEELERQKNHVSGSGDQDATFQGEFDSLRTQVRMLTAQVSGSIWSSTRTHSSRSRQQKAPCPSCGIDLTYTHKFSGSPKKAVHCKGCSTRLVSVRSDINEFSLIIRKQLNETVACPSCTNEIQVKLDELPGASVTTKCSRCPESVRVSRSNNGVSVTQLDSESGALTTEFLEQVKNLLPSQPWLTGAHIEVAEKLNVPPRKVTRAISELIRKGIFSDQIDGQLCSTTEKLRIMRGQV